MSIGRTRDGVDIAGWILKGDPKVFDLDAALENGRVIERWSVHDTYRKDLMGKGQRCVLWRSGPNSAIVAAGYVTGRVQRGTSNPSARVDPGKAKRAKWFVPVELHVLDVPIPRAELKAHPVLSQIELLRAKQMSNPTIVTPEELWKHFYHFHTLRSSEPELRGSVLMYKSPAMVSPCSRKRK